MATECVSHRLRYHHYSLTHFYHCHVHHADAYSDDVAAGAAGVHDHCLLLLLLLSLLQLMATVEVQAVVSRSNEVNSTSRFALTTG